MLMSHKVKGCGNYKVLIKFTQNYQECHLESKDQNWISQSIMMLCKLKMIWITMGHQTRNYYNLINNKSSLVNLFVGSNAHSLIVMQ